MARGPIDSSPSKPVQNPMRRNANNYFLRNSGSSKLFSNAAEIAVESPVKSRSTTRKRVRFAPNHNDVEEQVVFWRPTMTAEEIDSMWWSHLEYKIMRAEARETCENGIRAPTLSPYMSEYLNIFTSCIGMGPTEEDKKRLFQAHDDDRGLEDYYISFVSRDRRKTVYGVLVAQNKMSAAMEPDVKARLLSATSRHLSRSSRLLANVVAEADAIAAKLIQRGDVENPFRVTTTAAAANESKC